MKTYRAEYKFKYLIEEFDYVRETEHFITVSKNGRETRESKESDGHRYFTKFNDAKEWVMSMIDLQIKNIQTKIDRLKSEKQKVNNL